MDLWGNGFPLPSGLQAHNANYNTLTAVGVMGSTSGICSFFQGGIGNKIKNGYFQNCSYGVVLNLLTKDNVFQSTTFGSNSSAKYSDQGKNNKFLN